MSDETRVLFLRGVNVGATRKLPMADLRRLLEGLGLDAVQTHIQSGNAVFRDPSRRDGLAAEISAAIGAAFPFTPEAMVLDLPTLEAVLAANPFRALGAEAGNKVHIGFLARHGAVDAAQLDALAEGDEAWAVTDRAFYLSLPHGMGRSKLAAGAEKAVKVPMTMRNQRVAEAVADLARGLGC